MPLPVFWKSASLRGASRVLSIFVVAAEKPLALSPRGRWSPVNNHPSGYVDREHEHQEHKARGPRLLVQIFFRGDSVVVDHYRKRRYRLQPSLAPKHVAERSE